MSMRYRLRTLMILLAVLPVAIAIIWLGLSINFFILFWLLIIGFAAWAWIDAGYSPFRNRRR